MLDHLQSPFNASYAVVLVGATATFGVQFTLDDPNNANVTPVWFNDATNGTGVTASAVGNYTFPVRALRLNVAALSGGTIRFVVLQGSTA